MTETTTWTVTGMTCGHCVASVTEELLEVDGIEAVDVDLASGGLTVISEAPVEETAVRAAVEEAGYEVAGVTDVRVDLATGRLEVAGDRPVAAADVRAAVEEAGYRIA